MSKKAFRKKQIKNNKVIIVIIAVLLLFPLVVGLLYRLPLPQIIMVNSGDLLSFYGTSFGLFLSVYSFFYEQRKAKTENMVELRPKIVVSLESMSDNKDIYLISIFNASDKYIYYVYLYDEFICESIGPKKNKTLKVVYNKTAEDLKVLSESTEVDYNIDISDSNSTNMNNGLPEFIQVLCDDANHNSWNCIFSRIQNGDQFYYYPSRIEIP